MNAYNQLEFNRMLKLFTLVAMRAGGITMIYEDPDGATIHFKPDIAAKSFNHMIEELTPLMIFGRYEDNVAMFTEQDYNEALTR